VIGRWLVAVLLAGPPASALAQHVHPAPAAGGGQAAGEQTPAPTPAPTPAQAPTPAPDDHSQHHPPADAEQGGGAGSASAGPPLPRYIRPLTDEDRAAAFPDLQGHAVHDRAINYFVLADQLEWQSGQGSTAVNWDVTGWIGRDRNRFWFRTEGDATSGELEQGQAHALYGHQFSRWWDVVAGLRQDLRPGDPQTWAALGVQGLAPYFFEVEATGYVGAGGRTHFRFETEYELLLTNRIVLQPLVEAEIYGKSDPERGLGAGLSSGEVGLRLRYLIRREFAPYVGVVWTRRFFETADFAQEAGEPTAGVRLALGVRLWR
jgi:copper resistance protein B